MVDELDLGQQPRGQHLVDADLGDRHGHAAVDGHKEYFLALIGEHFGNAGADLVGGVVIHNHLVTHAGVVQQDVFGGQHVAVAKIVAGDFGQLVLADAGARVGGAGGDHDGIGA